MQGKKNNCENIHIAVDVFVKDAAQTYPHLFSFFPQIGNVKPETAITWFKDSIEIADDDEDAMKIEKKDGVLTFNIGKVSPLDRGHTL